MIREFEEAREQAKREGDVAAETIRTTFSRDELEIRTLLKILREAQYTNQLLGLQCQMLLMMVDDDVQRVSFISQLERITAEILEDAKRTTA